MGSVLLVRHVNTDEHFALKVLHESVLSDAASVERFRREARVPSRIDSDHVARVSDADVAPELGGAPFLVMEYLRGDDLEHLIEARGALPPFEVVTYLQQVARALDKAHAIGIVHRDLKPDNLFVARREDGTPLVKVLDFGIAKLDEGGVSSRTSTGQIFGTPLYMSPEQVKGESARVGPASDVWALGLIAFRALTGTDFWAPNNMTHLVALIAYEPIPSASERGASFGPAFDAWFRTCCARQPADRFAGAGAAVAALADALGLPGRGSLLPTAGPVSQAAPSARSVEQEVFASTALPDSAVVSDRAGEGEAGSTPPTELRPPSASAAAPATALATGAAAVESEPDVAPAPRPASQNASRPKGLLALVVALPILGGGAAWWLYAPSPAPAGPFAAAGTVLVAANSVAPTGLPAAASVVASSGIEVAPLPLGSSPAPIAALPSGFAAPSVPMVRPAASAVPPVQAVAPKVSAASAPSVPPAAAPTAAPIDPFAIRK